MRDIIIIGCGPAGMTAAIYALRSNKSVLIIEKESIGGQIASSPLVENYPGYKSISGAELSNNLYEQVESLGGEIELEEVTKIETGKTFKVITEDNTYESKAVIIATGSKYRLLGLSNEIDYIGNGIHFCVACDGAFYKDKTVAVIGGGNSAVINALSLSDLCKKVYVVQNLSDLTGEKVLSKKLKEKSNVEIHYNSTVKEIKGNNELSSIIINDSNKDSELIIDGMFISIGQTPQSGFLKDLIDLNDFSYVVSDNTCKTNIEGIYVAGDIRDKKVRQLTTAVNDGTIAALEAISYIDNL